MAFYPEKKKHISPSAFAAWYEQKSLFVRSYFLGEKSPETSAMRAGKKIHQLIEGNFLEVKHRYEHAEKILCIAITPTADISPYPFLLTAIEVAEDGTYELPEGALAAVYGVPDSYERHWTGSKEGEGEPHETAYFVDYKSGKENHWDDTKLAGDLKMKLTAWLVWNATRRPNTVQGFIEYIPTVWNPVTKEIEPTEGESVVAGKVQYSAEELEAFTNVIVDTIHEINAGFIEWEESTDEFVSQDDITEYVELDRERVAIERKQELIKERLAAQMTMGKKDTLATLFGTFYFTRRKKYAYPKDLPVEGGFTLESAEEIAAAAAAAKKKFETENKPETVSESLSFRPKK